MADRPALLERLRALRGIGREFTDFRGHTRALSDTSLCGLLNAFGHDTNDVESLARDVDLLETRDWIRVLSPVIVVPAGAPVAFTVLAPLLPSIHWRIDLEDGAALAGQVDPSELPLLEERHVRGLCYRRLALELPALPAGYHALQLAKADGHVLATTRLVITPGHCHVPRAIQDGARVWGPAVQLYTLRSPRNWGIGDFTDLAGFAAASAALGADVLGLNPLHALFPADPGLCGPYSPSSRYFLNVIYIDPEAIPEFLASETARRLVRSTDFQARLAALRDTPWVDYAGVMACKLEVLQHVYRAFITRADEARQQAFVQFRNNHGDALERYCRFHALEAYFAASGTVGGWPAWPPGYHDPNGPAATAYAIAEADAVGFHAWLQWVAAGQLQAAADAARDAGMRLGLYFDLAVGPNAGGAETWGGAGLYAQGATIGAPPDPLALQGQDWGIPPFDPDALREQAYAPFIRLLRANMVADGVLRIDHVMMLFRLWWVPRETSSAEGGYVHYRLDELMGLVALESCRQRCLVIGEDLGTVPPEVRTAMSTAGVFSYRVLPFEREGDGRFRQPAEYPRDALVALATHDLPPLASFWSGSDIDLREQLALFPAGHQVAEERAARAHTRAQLLAALRIAGLEPGGEPPMDALQRYLATTPSAVLMLQPEDWLGMDSPVNVPGTHAEYPNWRRKLSADWPEFMNRPAVRSLATAVNEARRKG